MNRRITAVALTLASFALAALQGCNNVPWVTEEEYLNTSLAPRAVDGTTTYGYVPPRADQLNGPVWVTPRYEEPPRIVILDANLPTVTHPISQERSTYAMETRDKLQSMQRDLDLVVAKATQKGMSALAAIDPKVRGFDTAQSDIELMLNEARTVDAAEWQDRTIRIDLALDRARRAVMEASNLADITPATQNPIDRSDR